MSVILGLLTPLLQGTVLIVGDKLAAKWLALIQMWWRGFVDVKFKMLVEENFQKLSAEWDDLKQDRKPGPRE